MGEPRYNFSEPEISCRLRPSLKAWDQAHFVAEGNPYYSGGGGGFVPNGSPFGSQDSPGGGKKVSSDECCFYNGQKS